MIVRAGYIKKIDAALSRSRIVVLSGPRQSGKTTLAREFVDEGSINYFDLEDPASLSRLDEPITALQSLSGLVVIDEVQRRPDLFPTLRVLVDRKRDVRFLILGSASGELLRQTSESLAGRSERVTIGGFSISELGFENSEALWLRGGFPLSYLSPDEEGSVQWRKNFIVTLLERDFPAFGVRISATALRRFWTMLAHYHGGIWNAAEPARALGVSESTTRRYLDLLTDALMVRQIQPYFANISKRQVKSPKIYIRDSGLLHQLLGIDTKKSLLEHPKVGASWEGFVIEQILLTQNHDEAFFWATHQGAEIDLILRLGDKLSGIEIKRGDGPKMTPSIRGALQDLGLEKVSVIYPGTRRYPLAECVEVIPAAEIANADFCV
ncbi:MAG: ATP-binding protein [Planctomycetes bacterium]|nr:ATP-binding protein [Planctomycetota bacterium]